MMASVPQAINQRYAIPPSSKIAQLAGREPLSPPSSTHSVAEVEFEVKKDTITKAAEELTKTVSKNGSLPQAANRDAALDTLDTSYRAPSRAGSSTSRKKRLYYSEAFAVRDGGPPIPKTAGVLVELKTNVIVSSPLRELRLPRTPSRDGGSRQYVFLSPLSIALSLILVFGFLAALMLGSFPQFFCLAIYRFRRPSLDSSCLRSAFLSPHFSDREYKFCFRMMQTIAFLPHTLPNCSFCVAL